ncbi:MAG: hypothetical protein E7491_09510 [Ruminococcaceae bacterium]|nr:hypothetical protein [Oscillospiraceae bacterium]
MKKDPSKIILTFTATQWYCMPDAFMKMAQEIHKENMPVTWQINYETAETECEQINAFHEKYGDEIMMIGGGGEKEKWQKLFPWSKLNIVGGARPSPEGASSLEKSGIEGVWGYCDFQTGNDGITHWGCPWGMFRLSKKVPFIPSTDSDIIGIPWTLRDIHKTYSLNQAINFCTDPIEHIRTKTLDKGDNISFFQNLFDELLENTAWNERVYACIHEECDGPFIFSGKETSNEGATAEQSELMYGMMRNWIRYAKRRGATVMTLAEAVEDYKAVTKGGVLPSTLLTRDKHHGRIFQYVLPPSKGTDLGEFGDAGNFPDTIFHYDKDCMLIFRSPSMQPETVLDYKTQTVTEKGGYPRQQELPYIRGWECNRTDDEKTFEYRLSSWVSIPYGLFEWGNFEGWKVKATNFDEVKIIGNRGMLLRFEINLKEKTAMEINDEMARGMKYFVTLERE